MPWRLLFERIIIAPTRVVIPKEIELSKVFPTNSRIAILPIFAGAPVVVSITTSPSIFLAGEVPCCQRMIDQMSQPIPQVTIASKKSRAKAPNLMPLSHGVYDPL